MTVAQKVIKYVAFSFAIFLIFSIFSGIFSLCYKLSGVYFKNDEEKILEEVVFGDSNFSSLDIDVDNVDLNILNGSKFKLEISDGLKCINTNGNLKIQDKNGTFFNNKKKIDLYLPDDIILDKTSIDISSGNINIEILRTESLDLDIEAGTVVINELYASSFVSLFEAAKFDLLYADVKSFKLGQEAGSATVNALINDYGDFDLEAGSLVLNLIGSEDDYKFKVDKVLGKINISSEDVNDKVYGDGNTNIVLDLEVGNISVNFLENGF